MSIAPLKMLSAPLRLTAMTLRGLGPYLHGARLEIKPLTILCGENGSGKSTWIETLRALDTASRNERFPLNGLSYPTDENTTSAERYGLNQTLAASQSGLDSSGEKQLRVERLKRPGEDQKFGPLGSIGLEFKAMSDVQISDIPSVDHDPMSDAQSLLMGARISTGARLSLRWALPVPLDGFEDLIELRINSECIRLRRKRDRTPESKIFNSEAKEPHLTFECTAGFLGSESSTDGSFIELGHIELKTKSDEMDSREWNLVDGSSKSSRTSPEGVEAALERFLELFREVVCTLLRGFFPIGPIRNLLTEISADSTPPNSKLDGDMTSPEEGPSEFQIRSNEVYEEEFQRIRPDLRYVGHNGSRTQFLHAFWAYNLMRQPMAPYEGAISSEFEMEDFKHLRSDDPFAARYFNNIPSSAFRAHILRIVEPSLREEWQKGQDSEERNTIALRLLNSALRSRNLFAPREFRPDISSEAFLELRAMIGETPEQQDEVLASRQLLSDSEVIRANRLLLEAVLNETGYNWVEDQLKQGLQVKSGDYPWTRCRHRTGYLLETFVSFWMRELTGTSIKYQKFEGEPLETTWNSNSTEVPNGGLVSPERQWHKRGDWAERIDGREHSYNGRSCDLAGTIQHRVLVQDSDWSLMSTGFHQLAPIVVQSALLHQNEIVSIENPEAHLHPSLQLKVAEFLMHQARAGKIMLVETHSDLLVRRVLRAIREEHISPGNVFKQSTVEIYFTDLHSDSNGVTFARIKQLEIDDHGQVQNWPDGFMNDDLKEAHKWMEAMQREEEFSDDE